MEGDLEDVLNANLEFVIKYLKQINLFNLIRISCLFVLFVYIWKNPRNIFNIELSLEELKKAM